MNIVGIFHGVGIEFSHIDLQPTVNIALIEDVCQITTTIECLVTDACHAVPNRNACQTATSVECTPTDACHAVPNRHACQIYAITECIPADACHAVPDSDACQTAASFECIIVDACHTSGDRDACQTAASGECTIADACHAVRDDNACQTAAIFKCTIANACYAVVNRYARQINTTCKRAFTDTRYCLVRIIPRYDHIGCGLQCRTYADYRIRIGVFNVSILQTGSTFGNVTAGHASAIIAIIMHGIIGYFLYMLTSCGMPMPVFVKTPFCRIAVTGCGDHNVIHNFVSLFICKVDSATIAMPMCKNAIVRTCRRQFGVIGHIMP